MSDEEYQNYRGAVHAEVLAAEANRETVGKGDGILPRIQVGGESF